MRKIAIRGFGSMSMITADQAKTFSDRGVLRLEGFLPREGVLRAREVVLGALERAGIWSEGHWRLDSGERPTAVNAGAELVKGIKKSKVFGELVTSDLLEAVGHLVGGRDVFTGTELPQLLFTLPNATNWTVPHTIWHLDVPRLARPGLSGVQMFSFMDDVAPRGGGTLVVTGSHRLLNRHERIRSKDVKRQLKREPYFRNLMSASSVARMQFMEVPGEVNGVELRVEELTGAGGDVYLMDMRALHTVAPNAGSVPRMMVTQRFMLEGCRGELYG